LTMQLHTVALAAAAAAQAGLLHQRAQTQLPVQQRQRGPERLGYWEGLAACGGQRRKLRRQEVMLSLRNQFCCGCCATGEGWPGVILSAAGSTSDVHSLFCSAAHRLCPLFEFAGTTLLHAARIVAINPSDLPPCNPLHAQEAHALPQQQLNSDLCGLLCCAVVCRADHAASKYLKEAMRVSKVRDEGSVKETLKRGVTRFNPF
jgi:hypothetical protein